MAETENISVLLVEDDFFISDMYQKKLQDAGFHVVLATDGDEVLKKLEETVPALILLDIMLPKRNGLEILREIKNHDVWKSIPVILLTNLSEQEYVEEGTRLGAADYVVKSKMTPADVVHRVQSLLGSA